jgi:hypothetical protein
MVQRYAHPGQSHVADWAGNVLGTNRVNEVPELDIKPTRKPPELLIVK